MVFPPDGLSATAVVQVTVTDVNDENPYFEPQQYALNVESTVALGPLLTVQGADRDSGDYGTVSYSFVNDNDHGYFRVDAGSGIQYSIVYSTTTWFRIDANNGKIYTKDTLGRESQQFVLLGMRAQTTGSQAHNINFKYPVHITAMN